MRRCVSLICESLCWADAEGIDLPSFRKLRFDLRPSDLSASTLWLMQTDDPVPADMWGNVHSGAVKVFSVPGKFLSNRIKTRIISNFWPAKFDPTFLDPKCDLSTAIKIRREPNAAHYAVLLDFLRNEWHSSDYRWLIYWSLIGHAECSDCRLEEENKGIPDTLRKTASEWFSILQRDVIPLLGDDDLVLIHPDHGSARRNLPAKDAFESGFLYCRGDLLVGTGTPTWADIRKMVAKWCS